MKKYCFGIDIGGTTVKCGLFDVQGNVLDKWEIKTRSEGNGENIIPDVAAAIETKISEKGIEKADIAGIGVGVPGPVNEEGAVVTAVNLHWGYVDLAGEMEKLTGITTKVGNDANVAALGEMWKGGGEGHKNVVMVTLGTGVGGGIIIGGTRWTSLAAAVIRAAWSKWLLLPELYIWQIRNLQKAACRQC